MCVGVCGCVWVCMGVYGCVCVCVCVGVFGCVYKSTVKKTQLLSKWSISYLHSNEDEGDLVKKDKLCQPQNLLRREKGSLDIGVFE